MLQEEKEVLKSGLEGFTLEMAMAQQPSLHMTSAAGQCLRSLWLLPCDQQSMIDQIS